MFLVVCGGSGSGKSEYAEEQIMKLKAKNQEKPLLYIATMMGEDTETKQKIQRHREMRKDKGFETLECFYKLADANIPRESIVLLDCMSNLVANECFAEQGAKENTVEAILAGVKHIREQCAHLVIVTNDVFSDGCEYDTGTQKFLRDLGRVNTAIAGQADQVVEVVCKIPIVHK